MKLYIVATPIGNLKDITLRALEVLRTVPVVLSEHSATTTKLLRQYDCSARLIDLHEPRIEKTLPFLLRLFREYGDIAYVSRAGTPGVSDPGARIAAVLLARFPDLEIIPVPGVSAVTAALSVSGIPSSQFLFLGFLPKKKHRSRVLRMIEERQTPIVLFESSHRLLRTLSDLKERSVEYLVVCRELTKFHEEIFRGNIEEVIQRWSIHAPKGEFVLVIPNTDEH